MTTTTEVGSPTGYVPATLARPTPINALAAEQRLDAAVARLASRDMSIGDVVDVLTLLSAATVDALSRGCGSDDPDVRRSAALGGMAAHVEHVAAKLRGLSSEVRSAPMDAVNESVEDLLSDCQNGDLGCSESVAPWDSYAPYCSDRCRSQGEARRP